ncbi:helicase-associated domain-containing protein [Salinibacterium sp. ZJ77]|uniref:helicase-associated domain-containing protein n=1 Tax=Salinibacterium sp. ZJ77 TaxID=2708337 RepID=UPI00141FC0D3|nr:helicase-associated domain-containing protein [Salinibacterium sp. ZJ77]
MAAASSSALAFAAWLRTLDDGALTQLLRSRPVREQSIRDVFDLAESLLEPASVQGALEHLDRPTLAVLVAGGRLAAAGERPDAARIAARLDLPSTDVEGALAILRALALVDDADGGGAPWAPVVDQLESWPERELPSPDELLDLTPPVSLEVVAGADHAKADRAAADRAFAVVVAVGELVGALESEPARLLQRGGTALPDWRRLLAATSSTDAELHDLFGIATAAQLVVADGAAWRPTARAADWRDLPRVDRWAALAGAWFEKLPEELRSHLRVRTHARWGAGLLEFLDWLYPAGGAWLEENATRAIRAAEALGVIGDGVPSTPGSTLLAEGPDAAAAAVAALFPADVRQVYIQHDLSLIAPGPLASDIDVRVREFADVEAVGMASSYRVTSASVTRALTAGTTIDSLRDFLAEISLTGIPQPLDYLLSEAAARFGSLRVGAERGDAEPFAHAYVRGDDPSLIGQLAIDQALAPLGLRRSGDHRVVTRFDAETLYWALVDARYPVVFEDEAGVIRHMRRRVTERERPSGEAPDAVAALVERLRAAAAEQPAESGAAWNARQLELAIRNKLEVRVTVRMPDDSEVTYMLEPAGLAGGRLRARDRRADIERTLPLSHITEVAPA